MPTTFWPKIWQCGKRVYIFENTRHVVVKFTSRWGVCAGATGSKQANDMYFLPQFHCFIGAYRENMEQGVTATTSTNSYH